jgi:NCAIR mutase (PurE)-related protein
MTKKELTSLLTRLRTGRISVESVLESLSTYSSDELGFATVDHHRTLRKGFPEVILCQGKTPRQTALIAKKIVKNSGILLATRATRQHFVEVKKLVRGARYHEAARLITAGKPALPAISSGYILVVTAGTSDIPVAEEAAITATMCGNRVERLFDVGVAGLHRLLSSSHLLLKANVIIVVAGMEGALPSVVGGLVDAPVIAVPTSTGYGTSFGGVSALLGMLNSCASGVTVVNIDNGFGAGFAAGLMNARMNRS